MRSCKNDIHMLIVVRHPVGGIRTFMRYLYKDFTRTNYRFTILAPQLPELDILLQDLKQFKIHHVLLNDAPSVVQFLLSVCKILLTSRFDIVHSHGFISGLCSALPAFISRTPHIMTIHDVLRDNQFGGARGRLKKKLLSAVFPLIDKIHAISMDVRDNLFQFVPILKKFPKKVFVVKNGIEIERFKDVVPEDFRRKYHLGQNTFLVGFLGRFMSQKGFRVLVDAMEIIVKQYNMKEGIVILAFGGGGFIREEKSAIASRQLEQYVKFMDFTPNIAPVLKGLDVIAIPSFWEACPLLPMEAMVAGTPVIGTNCIGLREVLKNTPARMVSMGNAVDLATAILQEKRNPSTAASRQFVNEACNRFDVKDKAHLLEKVVFEMTLNT